MATKKITAKQSFTVLREIINQPRFANALLKLDTSPEARAAAKKDARAYLVAEGIKLREETTAHFTTNKWKLTICIWIFCISFEHS